MNGFKTAVLLCALLIMAAPAAAKDAPAECGDYVRLHIVADDDTALKQGVKLAVRDSVRQAANELLAGCHSADDAFARLSENTPLLEAATQAVLDGWGDGGSAAVETGIFPFPDRQYGDLFLPAGDYRAVRVVLGRGEGHNWWCVLYPSLCLKADGDGERTVIFYSGIARWLQSAFARREDETWPRMPHENILNAAAWLSEAPVQPDHEIRTGPSARGSLRAADRRGALREATI